MMADGVDLGEAGWTRLPFRFPERQLNKLSTLHIHEDRGRRLTNMSSLCETLPREFKTNLEHFGYNSHPNRAVGFVKSKESNWSLPWHQDRVIAMTDRMDDPNFQNWSRKSGVWHCEPSGEILEKMAFAYIAFDRLDETTGGLQIAEGSHRHGKIQESDIESYVELAELVLPNMERGEVLACFSTRTS